MNWKKNWLGTSMLVVGLCVVLMMYGVSASKPGDVIKDVMRNATVNATGGVGGMLVEGAKGGMGLGQFGLMVFLIFLGMASLAFGLYEFFKVGKEGERVGNSSLKAWLLVIAGFIFLILGTAFSDVIAKTIGL